MEPDKKLTAEVKGAVQGVGYRYFVQNRARELQLSGFVQNLPNGSVKIVAEGKTSDLQKFLVMLKQGPRQAIVQAIDLVWEEFSGQFSDFQVKF